ncbi:MAG: class I SAM-dependent methyltransferase [Oscillospiraceae bacterium]|nr:class I SAM-dependent methyltransferase [Oscillospiraceae bacterium]
MPYEHLAAHYDALMRDMDYGAYAGHLLSLAGEPKRVLDLACGTGRLALELCERGCDVVAVDASPEMLAAARNKFDTRAGALSESRAPSAPDMACGGPPLFLQQDMAKLDLYGTVEAVFCTFDALNYLTDEKRFRQTLSRVRLFLESGGAFIFDLLAPEALAARDGMVFMSDAGGVYCVWRCSWEKPLLHQEITLFTQTEGGLWRREEETHTERAYQLGFVEEALRDAGFDEVRQAGMPDSVSFNRYDERLVFVAR